MKYTKESLQSTWGVVESKEHAEFIADLARSAGLITSDTWSNTHDYFSVNYNGLLFWSCKSHAEARGEKQITISLPPKDKEWPQAGDKACFNQPHDLRDVEVVMRKQPESGSNMSLVLDKNDHPFWVLTSSLSKPKTKQDLLTEELQAKLCNNNHVDNFTLASDIINGMIPGLSYNSDIESAVKGVINKNLDGGV